MSRPSPDPQSWRFNKTLGLIKGDGEKWSQRGSHGVPTPYSTKLRVKGKGPDRKNLIKDPRIVGI